MIKQLTVLLEKAAKRKLKRADKRNRSAITKLKEAKHIAEKTGLEFVKSQTDVRIQLNRLGTLDNDLADSIENQKLKYEALHTATKALES
jgi:hypothetical protein